MKKPLALIILDGFGYNESDYGNAILAADKNNIERIFTENPHTFIGASGMDVGLPDGQMGNSEVGHTNIGAGRIVYQELTRITKSIRDGDFYENEALMEAIENCKKNSSALHLMGLLSDCGFHSHNEHLYALINLAKKNGLENVYIHCFMDGRDVPPSSGKGFVEALEAKCKEIGAGKVASVMGRYYAMDRDNRFERVVKAYDAIILGEGEKFTSAADAIESSYKADVTDEFVVPAVSKDYKGVENGDSIVFFNFRPDRAREITRAIVDEDFAGFERKGGKKEVKYVCMTQYDAEIKGVSIAFKPQKLTETFGEILASNGKTQLRIAETEKYAHVTFFFNGGVEAPVEGEDRALIPSPKVATYDLKPEMSAYEVADECVKRIESGKYDVIVLNFANCDMVGHTGVFSAAKAAVEAVDKCLAQVVNAIEEAGGAAIITADHGNADQMYEPDGSPFTAHTTNPVPLAIVGYDCALRDGGVLADIAPTMLEIMGIEKPDAMTGESLIK